MFLLVFFWHLYSIRAFNPLSFPKPFKETLPEKNDPDNLTLTTIDWVTGLVNFVTISLSFITSYLGFIKVLAPLPGRGKVWYNLGDNLLIL